MVSLAMVSSIVETICKQTEQCLLDTLFNILSFYAACPSIPLMNSYHLATVC